MSSLKAITLFAILFLFIASCDTVDPYESVVLSEEDYAEAYQFALWYSGDLEPSESEINRFGQMMNQMRMRYGNRSDRLNDRFITPWQMGRISIHISQEAADRYAEEGVHPWDGEDEIILPDNVQTYQFSDLPRGLSFDKNYHPGALCEMYASLADVIHCSVNFYGSSGFSTLPVIVVPDSNGGMVFYFTGTLAWQTDPMPVVGRLGNGSWFYDELPQNGGFHDVWQAFYFWKVPALINYEPHGE